MRWAVWAAKKMVMLAILPVLFVCATASANAQNMQAQMLESQQRIGATVVEGQSGGGAVTIAVTGGFEFQSVTISPEVLPDGTDPDDRAMLEDLVLAALRDATSKVVALQSEANPLAGLGDLGGLFGGA